MNPNFKKSAYRNQRGRSWSINGPMFLWNLPFDLAHGPEPAEGESEIWNCFIPA
jgi:hypothetical protein